ncbi:DUF4132 domain-containing protein [Kitasatospora kifunensis]|uniref:Putative DNA-binding WGR domain protein n=1 Tax=Kitasatospora kifunensis TaxID=58351 RepID=A0A7W7R6A6_KITKI|nr:DUF4132 domain-containing protein [Kitasatospora kifunensis]MBB4926154.1 putative DNA-binding WGR domain protein [Kitasatospora kifunensis]
MRRWELVTDGSAKFWEAAVEGPSVRIRYGRIGTAGRVQLKELASADAAAAHFGKLVSEKERKGYTQAVGTPDAAPVPVPDAAPAPEPAELPDEDVFVLPAAWHRLVQPRRGGLVRTTTPPEPAAVDRAAQWLATDREIVEAVLADPDTDPTLVHAARAYLVGEADPLGAAVVSILLPPYGPGGWEDPPFADAWVVRHGLPFAARAVLELFEIASNRSHRSVPGAYPPPRFRAARDYPQLHVTGGSADRVRALLAAADEATYEQTVAALARCRDTPRRRLVTGYLAPGTPGWAEDCLNDQPDHVRTDWETLRPLLLRVLDDPAQVSRLAPDPRRFVLPWSVALIATLAEALGMACVPLLREAIETADGAEQLRAVTAAVARFPSDDAFGMLLSRLDDKFTRPALQQAMERYPRRATRLLAAAALADGKAATTARHLLRTHLAVHRAVLPQLLQELDPAAVELVHSLGVDREQVAEAAPAELPALLVSPPWTRKRSRRSPRVLTGLQPDAPQLAWQEGEQESWAAYDDMWGYPDADDWAAEAVKVLRPETAFWSARRLLLKGPADELAPWLESWRPVVHWGDNAAELRPVIAKYGLTALPTTLAVAAARPAKLASLLFPFRDAAVARLLADWLIRLKTLQPTARSWFARHGTAAALLLVPDAVGPAGAVRQAAEQALRLAAAPEGDEAVLAAVSARYGTQAAEIVGAILAADPLESTLPARLPEPPAWVQPAVLPQLLLTSGAALPPEAVRHVLTVLALSKPGQPYPGLAVVRQACRADSLAEFAWSLFEQWQQAALPAKESWILHALGLLGDDETVRRLSPVLRSWPGEGAHHRAVEGLDVLAAIGTDTALLHLHSLAQRVKFKALRVRAQEKIEEIAQGLGLSAGQLADRLVPDLGLDPDGSTVIDYGPRRFTVGFDEQLRPFVRDCDGVRRKDLPTPGARDDQELAPAERKRFAALKREVRTVAADQLHRLEAAMLTQRSWTAAEFNELFVRHPLVCHLTRRLVWLAEQPGAGTPTAFRVTEDHTFADVHDDGYALPEDATVRLPHPLHLGAGRSAWAGLFADHEIAQPFPQLRRPVRRFTPQEAAGHRLHRFEGGEAPVGRLLGLTKRGWQRGEPQDAGIERWFSKQLGPGVHLVIQLDEGISTGYLADATHQAFRTVWLGSTPCDYWPGGQYPLRFGDLDPVTACELLADLEEVTAG